MIFFYLRERNIALREKYQSVASHTHPNGGWNPKPLGVGDNISAQLAAQPELTVVSSDRSEVPQCVGTPRFVIHPRPDGPVCRFWDLAPVHAAALNTTVNVPCPTRVRLGNQFVRPAAQVRPGAYTRWCTMDLPARWLSQGCISLSSCSTV